VSSGSPTHGGEGGAEGGVGTERVPLTPSRGEKERGDVNQKDIFWEKSEGRGGDSDRHYVRSNAIVDLHKNFGKGGGQVKLHLKQK